MIKPKPCFLRLHLFLLLLTLFTLACIQDDFSGDGGGIEIRCGITPTLQVSFTANTATFTKAADPKEQSLLSETEQALSNPTFTHCDIIYGIADDGTYYSEIQLVYPDNYPYYPTRTIGQQYVSNEYKADKIVTCDGTTTYYNIAGDIINEEFIDNSVNVEQFSGLIRDLSECTSLTTQEMSWLMEAFREAGYDMSTFNDDLDVLTHTYPDGSFSRVVIDKNLQTLRGQANFDVAGNVTSKSSVSFTENSTAGNLTVSNHRFATYLPSPISGTRLCITRQTSIENFSLIKN